jgi:hypothetical protein
MLQAGRSPVRVPDEVDISMDLSIIIWDVSKSTLSFNNMHFEQNTYVKQGLAH